MDKFPVLWGSGAVGEVTVQQEGLYTEFTVCCRFPEAGLWCVWMIGEFGELRLGVMESAGGCGTLRWQFSRQMTTRLGRLIRGELRPIGNTGKASWERIAEPSELFQTTWLRQQLCGIGGAMFHRESRRLALPYDAKKPFPLLPLFCFARVCSMGGRLYVLYRFDEKEQPLFPGEKI